MTRLFIGGLLASCLLYAQTPDPSLGFEVASVKLSAPTRMAPGVRLGCNGGPGTDSPGQITCSHAEMSLLLRKAFGLQAYQYKPNTGPIDFSAPVRTGGFDVLAKIPSGATAAQVRTMFQNLLVERFKLAYHFETKDSVVYDLVAAKGGPKLKEAAPETDDLEPASPKDGKPAMGANGCPIQHPRRGTNSLVGFGRVSCYTFSAVSMVDLVYFVTARVGGPVVDLTNLKGRYDFSLRFSEGDEATDDASAPTLLTALQQQLGLRLEKKKGTVQMFVVDRVEKTPSEN
jgi:uncharacterized protein (TIGR03435 family)